MTIVGKLKISPHVEKFEKFRKILENFAALYALSCGEKLSQKVHLWRKMTNIRSDPARFWGISKGQFLFMPLGLGQIMGGGGWGAFSVLKSTQA